MKETNKNENTDIVSVVIPTYNRASTIERSIYSVLNQTYQNIELIVVDDNSNDDTENIVRAIQDTRIVYIKNAGNQGVATSRNIGIERATGEFIAFNDSDDTWELDKLEKQMFAMNRNPDCMLVYCAFDRVYLDGHIERIPDRQKRIEDLQGNIFKSLLQGNFVSTQTMLFRRKCLEQTGLFKSGLRALDDYELVLRVAEKYKILFVDDCLVKVFESADSINIVKNNYRAHFEAHLYILEKYWNKVEDRRIFRSIFTGMYDYLNYVGISELEYYVKKMISCFPLNKELGDILTVLLKNQRRYQYKDTVMRDLTEISGEEWKRYRDVKKIFKIAIYGNGYIGHTIRIKAQEAGIKVAYTVDKDAQNADYTIESLEKAKKVQNVDLMVISIFDGTGKVKDELEERIKVPAVHIDELLEEIKKGRISMRTKCYIYGAGKYGKLLFSYLNESNEAEVIAFIDQDIDKQNLGVEGTECISLDEAVQRGGKDEVVFISLKNGEKIKNQLQAMGFTRVFCTGPWMQIQMQTQIMRREYFIPKIYEKSDYIHVYPFNHYESPYPDITEIHKQEAEIFNREKEVLDIDFNTGRQFELLKEMEGMPLPGWPKDADENKYRYYYNNSCFGKGSADALYYMLRIVKPRRIIEIGAGYSTAVMLDTNENYFGNSIQITSVEPRADRLKALLKPTDNLKVYEKDMQDVPLDFFGQLEKDDILFVDSSHVSRINSDVNRVFFEILPRLKQGVYVHFHDIIYPFIYPKQWIYEGRAYSEAYLLRAFLMNNSSWSVQFFGNMLKHKYPERLEDRLRDCGSGSIWLRKEKVLS